MKGHELEKAMMDFLEKKYDVLLCTKIIESGIDIPSVNHNHHKSGRPVWAGRAVSNCAGRVGRSKHSGVRIPSYSSAVSIAAANIKALAGDTGVHRTWFRIQSCHARSGDPRAGNLLGGEQSGFILEMGFEMYQRVVEEAVAELKEEEFKDLADEEIEDKKRKTTETVIETDIEALIPDIYIGVRCRTIRYIPPAVSL